MPYLHLICDYAPGDMAWAEVCSAFAAKMPENARIHLTSVASFDTIATGFILAQLALSPLELRPEELIIFANCAPRKDVKEARVNNEGEGLLFGTTKRGVQIVAVNSGFSLSFVRDQIQELWSTDAEEFGSQFRSRDFFPRVVSEASGGHFSFIRHRLDPQSVIPEPPKSCIGYVDSFGNIKTSIRASDQIMESLEPGDRMKIRIGSQIRAATVATGSFNVLEGELAFAPGSSGHENRFWELFKRGGSAWREFGQPSTGTKIHLEKA
jgi:hypothetical protein